MSTAISVPSARATCGERCGKEGELWKGGLGAVGEGDLVDNGRRGDDEIEIVLALEALLWGKVWKGG